MAGRHAQAAAGNQGEARWVWAIARSSHNDGTPIEDLRPQGAAALDAAAAQERESERKDRASDSNQGEPCRKYASPPETHGCWSSQTRPRRCDRLG